MPVLLGLHREHSQGGGGVGSDSLGQLRANGNPTVEVTLMNEGQTGGWFGSADEAMQRDPTFVPTCDYVVWEADDTTTLCHRDATHRHVFRAGRDSGTGEEVRSALFFCDERSAQHAAENANRTISTGRISRESNPT